MAINVTHSKVSTIPDGDDTSLIRPSDWNDDHVIAGLGTMAEQNANAVAITGGTISGVTLPASNITGTLGVPNGGTGATTLTGYVKGTGTTAMTASSTIPNTDITGLGTASTKDAGVANGVATLDGSGTVPISQLPSAVLGALSYQGTWNASTNTPTLTSSVGTKGYYYVVSVAGSTNLNGITDWLVGDWAVYNGTAWQKVDNTDAVTSVNGYTGTVVLTQPDISGTVPTSRTLTAGTGLTGGGDLSADRTFAIDSTVVTLTGTQTLTNKTLTSPKVNEILDTNGNEILGLSPTASATDFLTVKNGIGVGVPLHIYADGSSTNVGMHIQPKGTGLVTISDGTDFNKGIRFRSSGSAASAITLLDAVATSGRVVTLPDATTTLVGRDTTDTLTNKSISGTTNTLSNIGNSSLTNSTITINGNSTALGGSVSVGTVTSVDLTASTGISVSGGPITGSGSITVTNTAPDQTVAIASGTGISVTGTYPNFTVTNTSPSSGGTVTSITAGTGLSGGTITSSGTIALANTTVSAGSYTNSSITVDAQGRLTSASSGTAPVTSVTGTSPVVSSGGATPAISLASGYGDTQNPYASKTANYVLAAPNGSAGVPTFRAIVAADIPTLNQNTTGSAATATTATNATNSAITNDDTTNATMYPVWVTANTGNLPLKTSSGDITFNPSTGLLNSKALGASNGIVVNNRTISATYSIPSGYSATSAGPITISSGVSVTVPTGGKWVVL